MAVSLDHVTVPTRDIDSSARFLANILAVAVQPVAVQVGGPAEFLSLKLAEGRQVLFEHAENFDSHHVAFRVSAEEFGALVDRIRATGIPFGNDLEKAKNKRVEDPQGGYGRVYFYDANGHFYEVWA